MLRITALLLACGIAATPGLTAQSPGGQSSTPRISLGAELGYHSGLGVQFHGMLSELASGFPLKARLGLRYASVGPGEPLDARRIFINNATNGTPEKSGRTWGFNLDLLYPMRVLSLPRSHVYGGVRYARFTGNFVFVGGNEDFDIRSSHWGLGAGLESYWSLSQRVDLVLSTGVDYFFASTMNGHDTSYSPDGTAVNPREDFTYSDADAAVSQPKLEPALMLGFNYHF
jgi:hypothetical protein